MTKKAVMLDAGHYSYYNQSNVLKSYYEGNMSWTLHKLLKKELEALGIEVGVTRSKRDDDFYLYNRGYKAKGYDMFVSLHSNWCKDKDVDRVVIIKGYDQPDKHAKILGEAVSKCMGISKYQVFELENNNGGEYYGVLRGAKAAGVKDRFIIEHSFHSNLKAAKWLSEESNLEKLAKDEAKAIAKILGVDINKKTKYVRVIADSVNIHNKPSFDSSSVISAVPKGTVLTIVDEIDVPDSKTNMYLTKADIYITTSSKYVEVFEK